MSVLSTDYITTLDGSVRIPVKELEVRTIQYYTSTYTSGEWNPNNSYNWVPGAYRDFTPLRADSRIKWTARLPTRNQRGSSHAISSWRFYVNGALWYSFSESGTHIENGKAWEFEVPSWGTSSGRIGMQIRSHANDNHEVRIYGTDYWNGTGSVQNCYGQMFIEEILY